MADIPKIRFKGFTEPWEQRKLGEVGTTYTGLSGKTADDFGHGEASFITYMNVFSHPVANSEMVEHVEIDNKQREVQVGDVFFTTSSETPEEVGMSSVLKEKHGVTYLNSFCFGFRPNVKFDLDYLAYMLRSEPTRSQIKILAQGISRFNISKNKMMDINIQVPNLEEQAMVGAYFRNLDHLITLHQRKCDDTKELKKYMLQKMFPKNGEKFPEIRFKGFTEAWEQRKLEAVLSLLKDGTHGTHQDAEEGPYLLSAKNIKNGQIIIDDSSDRKISEDEFNQIHTKFTLENGDILLTIVGSIGESAILESAGKFTFQRSVAFLRPSEEMTSRFLKTEIESVQFQKELNDRKSQSAQPGVYLGDLSKIPIYITSKEEQKKIGKYFSHLDNLITLHQRKCDTLKELKKYMLQNMFPKKG